MDRYTHGHHESVLRSHAWRTAENSAGYLLDSLQPGQELLDVGCGPGTITIDLAERVAPGRVVGIDSQSEVIARADELRQRRDRANVTFSVGDVYALRFDDARFDVVHAHQLLQHLTRPVDALKEMYRVMRPGGILGVRDSDYAGFAWAPRDPRLERWMHLYHQLTRRNGAEADAGRHLLGWVQTAGFTDAMASSSTGPSPTPRAGPGGPGCGPTECGCHRLLTRRWNMSLPTATSSTLWQMRGGNGLISLTVFSLFSMARCSLAGPPWTHKILWSQNELRSSQVTESGRRLFPRVFAFSRRLIQPWTSLSWIGAPIVTSGRAP